MRIPGNAPGPAEQSRSSTGVSKSADRIPERHVSSEDVRPQAPGRVGEQREWGGMKVIQIDKLKKTRRTK